METVWKIGCMERGARNLITDMTGVRVGHTTIDRGDVHTGVTAIPPCPSVPDSMLDGKKIPSLREYLRKDGQA